MAKYKCHGCGKECDKPGMCAQCNRPFDKKCQTCGAEIHCCTCTGSKPQTKGHAPR